MGQNREGMKHHNLMSVKQVLKFFLSFKSDFLIHRVVSRISEIQRIVSKDC